MKMYLSALGLLAAVALLAGSAAASPTQAGVADFDNSPSWVADGLAATGRRAAPQVPPLFPADAGFVTALAADPTHPNTVYAGTVIFNGSPADSTSGRVYKSIDSGNHWRLISRPGWPRIGALTIDPRRPHTVYVGTGKDLYKTTNGGRTWHAWNRGLLPPPGVNRGEGWTDWIAVDPRNSKIVYEHDYANTLRKSIDGGHSWKVMLWHKGRMSGLLMTPGRPPALYAGFSYGSGHKMNGVYRSLNGAKTWRKLRLPAPSHNSAVSAVDPQQNTIYVAIGARIYASSNTGRNWRLISRGLGLTPNQFVTGLAAGGGNVFATFWQRDAIYRSADGGGTWTRSWPASTPTPGRVGDIVAVDPARPSTVYAVSYTADATQILRSTNSGRTWTVVA